MTSYWDKRREEREKEIVPITPFDLKPKHFKKKQKVKNKKNE